MIKPEIDLELSIKALEVYDIDPNIIKSMLDTLQKVVKQNCNLQNVNASFLPKCTRVEVIDQSGKAYVNWKPTNKVQMMMQDNYRTLKVFIT